MKTYSDSPGAIYPALRRLEANGLIRGKIEQGAGLRRRQIFRLTSKGLAELEAWIRSAVTRDDLVRGAQLIMLRVAFSESVVGPDGSLHLLHSIEAALKVHLQALGEEFNQIRELAPTSARLAFEGGIRGTSACAMDAVCGVHLQERKKKRGRPIKHRMHLRAQGCASRISTTSASS